jgi:hypothetical protein
MHLTKEQLKENGFTGFKSAAELLSNTLLLPKIKGVYVVIHPNPENVSFLEKRTGGYFKGKDPNVSIAELSINWVKDSMIVYIGQCGSNGSANTLNKRIKQYLEFGIGKNVGHYGGRYIWQLNDNQELLFA